MELQLQHQSFQRISGTDFLYNGLVGSKAVNSSVEGFKAPQSVHLSLSLLVLSLHVSSPTINSFPASLLSSLC